MIIFKIGVLYLQKNYLNCLNHICNKAPQHATTTSTTTITHSHYKHHYHYTLPLLQAPQPLHTTTTITHYHYHYTLPLPLHTNTNTTITHYHYYKHHYTLPLQATLPVYTKSTRMLSVIQPTNITLAWRWQNGSSLLARSVSDEGLYHKTYYGRYLRFP